MAVFNRLARYNSLINDSVGYQVSDGGRTFSIERMARDESFRAFERIAQDMRWSILATLAKRCGGDDLHPSKVSFTYPKPKNIKPYTEFFNCDVVFGASVEKMEFLSVDARREFTTANFELADLNDKYLNDILEKFNSDKTVDRVRRSINF